MYYTVQIRLRTDEEQHQMLLTYEKIYLTALQNLIETMTKQKSRSFKSYDYPAAIEKSSQWMLYNTASKIAKAHRENRQGDYHRSGTWASNAFKIIDHYLFLDYGTDFPCRTGRYLLALNSRQQYQLQRGKQVRLDLVHDENCWYCNILMQVQDT